MTFWSQERHWNLSARVTLQDTKKGQEELPGRCPNVSCHKMILNSTYSWWKKSCTSLRSHPHTPGRYPGRFTNSLWRNFFLCGGLGKFGVSSQGMWAKSWNQLRLVVYPIIYRDLYTIPGSQPFFSDFFRNSVCSQSPGPMILAGGNQKHTGI